MSRETERSRLAAPTPPPPAGGRERAPAALRVGAALLLWALPAALAAEPIRPRALEGPSHGFVALFDEGSDRRIAHGELTQWLEDDVVANRLVIRFDDGSLYDERLRFEQQPVLRLLSYKLEQRGPSFAGSSEIEFDRSGRYRVRLRPNGEGDEERASGTFEVPDDLYNGMTSTLLKALMPAASATTHLVAFTPEPQVLELAITAEGTDRYWVGPIATKATRFLMEPRVTGALGIVATFVGKQPPTYRMWIAQGRAPVLVRFVGPLYAEGPSWRIELTGPRWEE